jgi:hypothetical protein
MPRAGVVRVLGAGSGPHVHAADWLPSKTPSPRHVACVWCCSCLHQTVILRLVMGEHHQWQNSGWGGALPHLLGAQPHGVVTSPAGPQQHKWCAQMPGQVVACTYGVPYSMARWGRGGLESSGPALVHRGCYPLGAMVAARGFACLLQEHSGTGALRFELCAQLCFAVRRL